MATKGRVAREVAFRANLLVLGIVCAIAASAFWIGVTMLWGGPLRPLSVVLVALWLFGSTPVAIVLIMSIGDVILYVTTGGVVLYPAMDLLVARQRALRELSGRPARLQVGAVRGALFFLAFYTNPLTPMLVGLYKYLRSRPPLEAAVREAVAHVDRRPPVYHVMQDAGTDWQRGVRGHLRTA